MKNRDYFKINIIHNKRLLIIIAVLIILAAIITYFGCYSEYEKSFNAKMAELFAENKKAISTASISSDWKTYKNEEYGFQFKYPADWTIDDPGGFNFAIYFHDEKFGTMNVERIVFTGIEFDSLEAVEKEMKAHYLDKNGAEEVLKKQNGVEIITTKNTSFLGFTSAPTENILLFRATNGDFIGIEAFGDASVRQAIYDSFGKI